MKNNQKLPNILRNQKFYFIFCIQKMYLISAKGYESAGVDLLRIKKTGKIWVSMKNAQDGLGDKSIFLI